MTDTYVPTEDGRWVSLEFVHLSEIIQDYDTILELRWIPPEQRETREEKLKPYAVVDTVRNQVVMYACETDDPRQILAKLFDIDNQKGDVLKRMNARNDAIKAFQLKQEMEEREQAKELAAFFIKNEKSRIKHNGVWFDDELRRL